MNKQPTEKQKLTDLVAQDVSQRTIFTTFLEIIDKADNPRNAESFDSLRKVIQDIVDYYTGQIMLHSALKDNINENDQ